MEAVLKNYMTNIILVTGCAGFIGSHVTQHLLALGHTVIGIDEMNDYYDITQKQKNVVLLNNPKFTFYTVSFTDLEKIEEIFNTHTITHIAHLGARAGVRSSIQDPYVYIDANITGTTILLECARKYNVKQFVLTSSSSVYGNNTQVPFSESETPTDKPVSQYAATKKACEVIAYTYHQLYKLNINVIRPFTIYGPRGRPDMAPYLFMRAAIKGASIKKFGDGNSARDYTYIDDFVAGFVSALFTPLGYEIFNLGNSSPVTLNEFIHTIERVSGKKLSIVQESSQAGDVDITYADISKAKRLLGYNPTTSLQTGLTNVYEWMRWH